MYNIPEIKLRRTDTTLLILAEAEEAINKTSHNYACNLWIAKNLKTTVLPHISYTVIVRTMLAIVKKVSLCMYGKVHFSIHGQYGREILKYNII